jgi:DNA-binding NtrC family response regulator
LEEGTALIGAHPDCDLVLTDPTVSRRHAQVELHARKIRVTDLNSKNGTFYLGGRVQQIDVPLGAAVDFGSCRVAILPDQLPAKALSESTELHGLIGRSAVMRHLFAELEQVGPADSPVLIQGETGTGKELVAQALHALSPRASGPFRVFDCASVESELLPSALFGHVRGAFTDAKSDAAGAIHSANGGTLFLDEIGELPGELQRMLLRVLETGSFTPVGGNVSQRSDFRLVAATHRDLRAQADSGRFRADLYYRLAAIELHVPPLRARLEDIPLLVEHFCRAAGATLKPSPTAAAALAAHRWTGNVRELRNLVQRALTLGEDQLLNFDAAAAPGHDFKGAREQAIAAFERQYVDSLLARHQGSVAAAAREAGVTRSYLYRLMEAHGLSRRK